MSRTRITFRPLDGWWPRKMTPALERDNGPFRVGWADTLALVADEIWRITPQGREEAVIQLELDDREIRNDGWPRARALPAHPGVVVSAETVHGPLQIATDRFAHWHNNMRAVGLALTDLRRIERYGIVQGGEQYVGWRALPAGDGSQGDGRIATAEQAAKILAEHGGPWDGPGPTGRMVEDLASRMLIQGRDTVAATYRAAARKHHPDAGGDPETWLRIRQAYDLLQETTKP